MNAQIALQEKIASHHRRVSMPRSFLSVEVYEWSTANYGVRITYSTKDSAPSTLTSDASIRVLGRPLPDSLIDRYNKRQAGNSEE